MHDCPECGQACSCSGDIEDHDTGREFEDDCTHCYGVEPDDDDVEFLDEESFHVELINTPLKTLALIWLAALLLFLVSCESACPHPKACAVLRQGGWVHGTLHSGDHRTRPTRLWVDGINCHCCDAAQ